MNSILNPEAPEFYPHLKTVTQGGYSTIKKSVKSSNTFAPGGKIRLLKTFTQFDHVKYKLSEGVVAQSNEIITAEFPDVDFISKDKEFKAEKIDDANDSMLDRINVNIDNICYDSEEGEHNRGAKRDVNNPWTKPPVISKIEVKSATFIGAKNIPRPQFSFKQPIDNSENLWVPKISDKPNNVKPLALNILYNEDGKAVGYEHPYKVELELYHPPSSFIDADVEPYPFPLSLEETQLTYIETESQVDALVEHLSEVKELAVDVEHHNYRSYQGITCLIQISTIAGDFIIDALAVRDHLHKLNLSFTDPKKIKVFHGAEMDVLWLQRDFGVYIVGLFDTHQAAKALKLSGLSLKNLLFLYCKVQADKKYQLADWRIRPLPEELIKYARMDTHYLLYIWRKMKNALLVADEGQPNLLLSVFEQSRLICGATYNKQVVDDNSHLSLFSRCRKRFNWRQLAALKLLYKWRDTHARELDESTSYLIPNHMLLSLAEALPREVQGVHACCSPMPPFVKQNVIALHRIILSCREFPLDPILQPNHDGGNVEDALPPLPPPVVYSVHDHNYRQENSEDKPINIDKADCNDINEDLRPDLQTFNEKTIEKKSSVAIKSKLNVDAKLFVPPHDRYRKYRTLAQLEDIKALKEKESKISVIGHGSDFIKFEVLNKLKEVKAVVEVEDKVENEVVTGDNYIQKVVQRKRKISGDKGSVKASSVTKPAKAEQEKQKPDNNSMQNKVKNKPEVKKNPKNVNYKIFYNDNATKQPKMKLKKH